MEEPLSATRLITLFAAVTCPFAAWSNLEVEALDWEEGDHSVDAVVCWVELEDR